MSDGRAGVTAAIIAAAMLSCGVPSDPPEAGSDAASDAGHDAAPHDAAPRDAARDTGIDAPSDGGAETTWTRIATRLPEICVIERADHPEAMDSLRLVWSECGGDGGCQRSNGLGDGGASSWWAVDDRHAIGAYLDASDRTVLTVLPLDGGPPLGASRSGRARGETHCAIYHADIHEGRVAVAVGYRQPGTGPSGAAFWSAAVEDFDTLDAPFLDDREHFVDDFPQRIYVSSGALVVDAEPLNLLYEISTVAVVPIFVTADFSATFSSVQVAGDRIFWDAYPHYVAWGRAGERGGVEYTRPVAPWQVSEMRTDGRDLDWLASHVIEELPDGTAVTEYELWTGVITADPADFVPRRVRALDTWGFPASGEGIWAVTRGLATATDPRRIELYDLSDGRRRTFLPPASEVAPTGQPPLAVEADRVVYSGPASRSFLVQFDPRTLAYDIE